MRSFINFILSLKKSPNSAKAKNLKLNKDAVEFKVDGNEFPEPEEDPSENVHVFVGYDEPVNMMAPANYFMPPFPENQMHNPINYGPMYQVQNNFPYYQ